ncbi:hypothetical protein [Marilutibacter spongiae]|uniref:Uncharacterized protein n=1 Tax=Marilutibacter spongiae TaxID=2025720 RepID=A0A7W3Y754_9GAMM|nr:hypothetical protein [Lysobacter spongiae]MBB1062173.1 hypothetical protein [Lysobacter spongiae]
MKRSIHIPALILLAVTLGITGAVILLLWQASQEPPHVIRCGHGGYSVVSCDTDFGNRVFIVVLIAAPIIVGLAHKAFFTEFKHTK